jgi:hypothetical protein
VSRCLFLVVAVLAAACTPVAPAPETPPPPRASDHFTTNQIQSEVEERVQERLGADVLGAARDAATSIMANSYQGRFDSGGPRLAVLVRTSGGWTSWKSGRPVPLAGDMGAELDRLLRDPAMWREEPFYPAMDCPDAGATMMVIRHRGGTRVTRQGCNPAGLTGKLEETVLSAP